MTDAAIITVIATGLEGAAAASPKVMPNMKYPQGTTARTNTMTRPNTMAGFHSSPPLSSLKTKCSVACIQITEKESRKLRFSFYVILFPTV